MLVTNKIAMLSGMGNSYWAGRILGELQFANRMDVANDGKYSDIVTETADFLLSEAQKSGCITNDAAQKAEEMLLPLSKAAKAYRICAIGHAHIDMNWMWGYNETTVVTTETFRTILDIMNEFPEFTFGQSQASTYKIIEDYAPEMLPEIRQRIKEGRWEVTASTWVENDKNMPNGESMARHILYTKQYLSKLLEIDPETLEIDFEPDTFGHPVSMPEILSQGGVKYYYHCRGVDTEGDIYRWKGRSGKEILVYDEPDWYNAKITADCFADIPLQSKQFRTPILLKVFGVGDHGGGPTRRDIRNLIDMMTWPIQPTVKFGTFREFFKEIETYKENFNVRTGELNFVFTGCYTSESRVKMANRIGEARAMEAEAVSSFANMLGRKYENDVLNDAWKKILFNQFHDIITGSGVTETREYAMGQFQQALSAFFSQANASARYIAERIDTSSINGYDDPLNTSEGAGVGFMTGNPGLYQMTPAERSSGQKRIFHLFNMTQYDFDGVTNLTVWDWGYDPARAFFADSKGNIASSQSIVAGDGYWGHQYRTFAVHVKVPAFGYATYVLDANDITCNPIFREWGPRVHKYSDDDIVMENSKIRAIFAKDTAELKSLVDKRTNTELVNKNGCTFRLIKENTLHGESAWVVGDRMKIANLNDDCCLRVFPLEKGAVRETLKYDLSFGQGSTLSVAISLDEDSDSLDFDVNCDFREVGSEASHPQLNFAVPFAYVETEYKYDVPSGTITRTPMRHDVPANSFALAVNKAGPSLMLWTDSKYGYRGADNILEVDLIRASYFPDYMPENGRSHIKIKLIVAEDYCDSKLYELRDIASHPLLTCTSKIANDTKTALKSLPLDGKFITAKGNIEVGSVKASEDGSGLIVRIYAAGEGKFSLEFLKNVASAICVDYSENVIPYDKNNISVKENVVLGTVSEFEILTLKVV